MATLFFALLSSLAGFTQDLPNAFPRENAKQVIDNERVTVWDVTWPKGKPTPMHRHKYDVVGVDLAEASATVRSQAGAIQTAQVKAGGASFLPKATVHIEEGTSDKPRHAMVIELKDAVVPPMENKTGFPLAFPREGAQKLIDNNRVSVWDYTWTLNTPTPMHFHDKDVVVVFMERGELQNRTADGRITSNPISFGDTRFNARNRSHSEQLVSGKARAIIVELK